MLHLQPFGLHYTEIVILKGRFETEAFLIGEME
jgi:hypothetical protein